MFVIKTNQDMTGTTKYKRQINLFKNLRKKSMKHHFRSFSEGNPLSSNRRFWKMIKSF